MAVNRTSNTTIEELGLYFNNGDLATLRETMNRLGFLNEESMIRYMIAILSKSATRSVSIIGQDGQKINFSPSGELLRNVPPTTNQ